MVINIIAMGKLKERYYEEICNEYIKRLHGHCKFKISEINAVQPPKNPSAAQIEVLLQAEAKLIQEKLPVNSYNIALCIEGKQTDSVEFANKINDVTVKGNSSFSFIIGSSFGLCETVKKYCDYLLSMSAMTFPHRLARVMLLEQIYRAFQIIEGGKYHK